VNFYNLCCFAEVGFILDSHLEMFFELSILLIAPFLNNHDLKIISTDQLRLGIVHFTANAHINES